MSRGKVDGAAGSDDDDEEEEEDKPVAVGASATPA
jgi:hypothetical protein